MAKKQTTKNKPVDTTAPVVTQGTQLVVAGTATANVKPKLTKAEVIEAMAKVEYNKRSKAWEAHCEAKNALIEELNAYAEQNIQLLGDLSCQLTVGRKTWGDHAGWMEVEFLVPAGAIPAEAAAILRKMDAMGKKQPSYPNIENIRKEVKARMEQDKGERIAGLVEDEAFKKAVEKFFSKE